MPRVLVACHRAGIQALRCATEGVFQRVHRVILDSHRLLVDGLVQTRCGSVIFLNFFDGVGNGIDAIDLNVDRQRIFVSVENRAALRGDDDED